MNEIVTTYKLDDLDQPIPMDRDEFYDEQIAYFKKKGKSTRAIEVVQLFLFTPEKQIILQKRAMTKKLNPGLIDKTVSGHVVFGDPPDYSMMEETLQEMSIPSCVFRSKDDFKKAYRLLKHHLHSIALVQFMDTRTYQSKKVVNREQVGIANKYHFYCGVYNGPIKPSLGAASGILFYPFDILHEKIAENPSLFGEGLPFLLEKYRGKINDFLSYFSSP